MVSKASSKRAGARVVTQLPNDRVLLLIGQTEPADFSSGINLVTIFGPVEGEVIVLDGNDTELVGVVFGEFNLAQAGMNDGNPPIGSVSSDMAGT